MDAKEFLINTLIELEKKTTESTSYDLIRISALLRQLLLDGNPLIHKVNRDFRVLIKFTVQERNDLSPKIGSLSLHGITPHTKLNRVQLKLENFLKLDVLYYHMFVFNIHDIIDFTAHKLGGVHFDDRNRSSEKEKAFDHLRKQGIKLGFSNSEASDVVTSLMVPISLVVIEALKPLKEQIQKVAGD